MNPEERNRNNDRRILDEIAREIEGLDEIFSRDDESIFEIYSDFENLKQLLAVINQLGSVMRINPREITELDAIPEHIGKVSQAYEAIENMHMLATYSQPSTLRDNPDLLRSFLEDFKPLVLNLMRYSKIPQQVQEKSSKIIPVDFEKRKRID